MRDQFTACPVDALDRYQLRLVSLVHAVCVTRFGVHGSGPLYSAFILLAEGVACTAACYGALRRSGPVGRYFGV